MHSSIKLTKNYK